MTDPKPLALIAVETADEARCDVLEELGKIKPVWKAAQENRDKAEADLLDAQTAARERFPDSAYDQETSHALNLRSEAHERRTAKFRALDSRKRSLDDKAKKMTAEVLRLVGEMREPGLWAAGDKAGPDGWKKLSLRNLVGGPDPEKDLEKQDWPCRELEKAGYHTIHEFLKGRARLIAAAIDDANLAADTVAQVDQAVYRFLERKGLVKQWPKDVAVPAGGQMVFDVEDDDGAALLDSVAPEVGAPAKADRSADAPFTEPGEGEPDDDDDEVDTPDGRTVMEAAPAPTRPDGERAPPLISGDLLDATTMGLKGEPLSRARKAAAARVEAMLAPWSKVFDQVLDNEDPRPDNATIARWSEVYGSSPAATLQRIWYDLWEGKPITTSPVSEGTTELFIDCLLRMDDDLVRGGHKDGTLSTETVHSEVMLGFIERLVLLPADRYLAAVEHLEAFDATLASDVAAVRSVASAAQAAKPAPTPKPAKTTKKASKKAGKKRASKR